MIFVPEHFTVIKETINSSLFKIIAYKFVVQYFSTELKLFKNADKLMN